jgi:hypothetical protein
MIGKIDKYIKIKKLITYTIILIIMYVILFAFKNTYASINLFVQIKQFKIQNSATHTTLNSKTKYIKPEKERITYIDNIYDNSNFSREQIKIGYQFADRIKTTIRNKNINDFAELLQYLTKINY